VQKKKIYLLINILSVAIISLTFLVSFFINKESNGIDGEATLTETEVLQNTKDESLCGGAIFVSAGSSYTMKGGSINSKSTTYGGAVYVSDGATFTIKRGNINDCSAEKGGAIYIENGGTCVIEDATINGSVATNNGGAIYVSTGATLQIDKITINGFVTTNGQKNVNTEQTINALNGGAIYIENGANCEFGEITINGCVAEEQGGAIYVESNNIISLGEQSIIQDCSSNGKSPNSIYASSRCYVDISKTNLVDSDGGVKDGAVLMVDDTADVKVQNNQTLLTNINGIDGNQLIDLYGSAPNAKQKVMLVSSLNLDFEGKGITNHNLPFTYKNCNGYFVDGVDCVQPSAELTNRKLIVSDLSSQRFYTREATLTKIKTSENSISALNTEITGVVVLPRESQDGKTIINVSEKGFKDITGITRVYFSTKITEIYGHAFNGCIGLNRVSFVQGLKQILYSAFSGCSNISGQLVIPDSVTTLGNSAFLNCSKMSGDLTIPDSVTTMSTFVFSGCTGLNGKITIGDGVTEIQEGVFYNCNNATSLEIQGAITSIGNSAFEGCSSLTGMLSIPKTVLSIGTKAFKGLEKISNLYFNVRQCNSFSNNASVFLGLGNQVPEGASVIIGKDVYAVPNFLLSNQLVNGVNADTEYTGTKEDFNKVTSIVFEEGGVCEIVGSWAFACSEIETIAYPDSVRGIYSANVVYCVNLTEVILPNNELFISINNSLFNGCSALNTITYNDNATEENALPESITDVQAWSFYGCLALKNLKIPNSLLTIGNGAFRKTGLEEIKIPNNVSIINPYTFYDCTKLKTVVLGDGVKSIALDDASTTGVNESAFTNCSAISYLEIQTSSLTISAEMFGGCTNLETLITASSILDNGFCGSVDATNDKCSGLAKLNAVTFNKGVENIGSAAFSYSPITTISAFPEGLVNIKNDAFRYCTKIASKLSLPSTLLTVGFRAFSNCTQLTGGVNLSSVTAIGYSAFYGCSKLNGDLVLNNNITTIGEYAFYNCTNLTGTLSIPNNSTYKTIQNSTFYGCKNLSGELIIPENITSIGNSAFVSCDKFTSLSLGSKLTSIGQYAFRSYGANGSNTSSLSGGLVIPNSVATIGREAFARTMFSSAILGSGLTSLSTGLFYYCSNLSSVTINESITTIGEQSFSNTGLKKISLPNTINMVYSKAFESCKLLTEVAFGATENTNEVELVPDAFTGSTNIHYLIVRTSKLKNNTTGEYEIYDELFGGCSDLKQIHTKTSIKASGFQNKLSLVTITLYGHFEKLGENAFSGCSNIKYIKNYSTIVTYGSNTSSYIDKTMFGGCSTLEELLTATTVDGQGFASLQTLKKLVFTTYAAMTSIGENAFNSCTNMQAYHYNSESKLYDLEGLVIPAGVTTIGSRAFRGCSKLSGTISFPSTLKTINDNAFDSCSSLQGGLDLSNVSSIGINAFINCSSFNGTLILPTTETALQNSGIFSGCKNLKITNLDLSIYTSLGYSLFRDCESLGGKLTLNSKLTKIPSEAFKNCCGLQGDLTIPDSVTTIDYSAFENCCNITGTIECNAEINSSAFSGCSSIEQLSVGSYGTFIGSYAFSNCANLEFIYLDACNREIRDRAFENCSRVKYIYLSRRTTFLNEHQPFWGWSSEAIIYHDNNTDGLESWSETNNFKCDDNNSLTLVSVNTEIAIYLNNENTGYTMSLSQYKENSYRNKFPTLYITYGESTSTGYTSRITINTLKNQFSYNYTKWLTTMKVNNKSYTLGSASSAYIDCSYDLTIQDILNERINITAS